MTLRERTRSMFPSSGAAYELFDAAVFLLVLASVGYVVSSPVGATETALTAPLEVAAPQVWGFVLAGVAVTGIVCSYRTRWLRAGYVVMIVGCSFWSLMFLAGVVLYGASLRYVASAVLYGWITSRLFRDIPDKDDT